MSRLTRSASGKFADLVASLHCDSPGSDMAVSSPESREGGPVLTDNEGW